MVATPTAGEKCQSSSNEQAKETYGRTGCSRCSAIQSQPVCQYAELEGIVLKDRTSTYRDGFRGGWSKVKDRSWYGPQVWRFDRS